jgi:nucleoside-diphosphate-sugar epimerase
LLPRVTCLSRFPEPGGSVPNGRTALGFAERGVRSMSVRFSPTVHGAGDNGFIAMIVAADRAAGAAAYMGEGVNRWSAVHRSDAARLVRLGIESAAETICTDQDADAPADLASCTLTPARRRDLRSLCDLFERDGSEASRAVAQETFLRSPRQCTPPTGQ